MRRNDAAHPLLERLDSLDLGSAQHLQLGGEVDDATLVVLRHPRVEPERSGPEVEVPALKRQYLALCALAEGVRDRRRDLEIRRQPTPHGLVLVALEEALARRALFQHLEHR